MVKIKKICRNKGNRFYTINKGIFGTQIISFDYSQIKLWQILSRRCQPWSTEITSKYLTLVTYIPVQNKLLYFESSFSVLFEYENLYYANHQIKYKQ